MPAPVLAPRPTLLQLADGGGSLTRRSLPNACAPIYTLITIKLQVYVNHRLDLAPA